MYIIAKTIRWLHLITKTICVVFVQFDCVTLAVKFETQKNSQFSEFLLSLQTVNTMNVSFEDVELEKLIITHQSKKYKKYTRDKKFLWALDRVFNDLQGVAKCSDLKQLSYLHYEQLKRIGLSSVRVMNGRVERLLFKELENGIRITIIELDETHYGQR